MNLRDLHYIVAVADLQNFGQAAERCFISQPTLSMQIKKLEESLGVQLFERSNKKVLITQAGAAIVESARRILEETQNIKQIAATAQDPLAGSLRLGAFPTLAPYLFPALVPLIRACLPNIRLILVEEKTEQLISLLSKGELDMALLALPIEEELFDSVALFADEFFLAVASDHPLAEKSQVEQADLVGESLLLLDEGHCLRGHALQVCQIHGLDEQQDLRATSLETLRQMVCAGTGITFMPKITLREDPHIRYIPFDFPPQRTIGLVWRKTSARTQLINTLKGLIQTSVAKIQAIKPSLPQ
ncbi:MAG: LysR family transcriptional regulator [Methylococcaceae bacterium]|nr:LysR family transcriptional regulator [Methylococcaceae bacterium]